MQKNIIILIKNITKYLNYTSSTEEVIDNLYEAIVEIENVPPTN